mmetsp:Transcript_23929/g.38449  ORF Transcript_23929/g.38449 Transcript_23929/m.38449 type:complete len:311 (+) Transcript_23929:392-1324(+)
MRVVVVGDHRVRQWMLVVLLLVIVVLGQVLLPQINRVIVWRVQCIRVDMQQLARMPVKRLAHIVEQELDTRTQLHVVLVVHENEHTMDVARVDTVAQFLRQCRFGTQATQLLHRIIVACGRHIHDRHGCVQKLIVVKLERVQELFLVQREPRRRIRIRHKKTIHIGRRTNLQCVALMCVHVHSTTVIVAVVVDAAVRLPMAITIDVEYSVGFALLEVLEMRQLYRCFGRHLSTVLREIFVGRILRGLRQLVNRDKSQRQRCDLFRRRRRNRFQFVRIQAKIVELAERLEQLHKVDIVLAQRLFHFGCGCA